MVQRELGPLMAVNGSKGLPPWLLQHFGLIRCHLIVQVTVIAEWGTGKTLMALSAIHVRLRHVRQVMEGLYRWRLRRNRA
jgi:hypothetical protein